MLRRPFDDGFGRAGSLAPAERRVRAALATASAYAPGRTADAVAERLALAPGDALLEVGCGSGRALLRLAPRLRGGFAVGVDPSPLMLRHAAMRLRPWIEQGRVRLLEGWTAQLPSFPDGAFHKAFGVHVAPIWDEPHANVAELRRVLRPGGCLVLGYRPEDRDDPGGVHDGGAPAVVGSRARPAAVESWLREAGFARVRTGRTEAAGPALAFTTGVR